MATTPTTTPVAEPTAVQPLQPTRLPVGIVSAVLGPDWCHEQQLHDGEPLHVWHPAYSHGRVLEWDGNTVKLREGDGMAVTQLLTPTNLSQVLDWLVVIGLARGAGAGAA